MGQEVVLGGPDSPTLCNHGHLTFVVSGPRDVVVVTLSRGFAEATTSFL